MNSEARPIADIHAQREPRAFEIMCIAIHGAGMPVRSKLLGLILIGAVSFPAFGHQDRAYENWLIRVGDYETLAHSWRPGAWLGDAEKQERLAGLYLGPHARQAKARPYEGIHFLFRAAVNGRSTAMHRLGDAFKKGAFGLSKRPDAARCWSSAPASFEERLACVKLSDFHDPQARVTCTELVIMEAQAHPNTLDGVAMAQLCLANKTPAILVQGLPPGQQDLDRESAYKRHGIEWRMTGDVYDKEFETFRGKFNQTIVNALEAEHGRGYLERLSKEIDASVSRK